jgi:hypothetical protein
VAGAAGPRHPSLAVGELEIDLASRVPTAADGRRAKLRKNARACSRAEHEAQQRKARRTAMKSNPLVGTWRLLSWENRSAEGTISYPLGRQAVGLIVYTDDGHMFVAIMRADREAFAAEDLLGGSRERRCELPRAMSPTAAGTSFATAP